MTQDTDDERIAELEAEVEQLRQLVTEQDSGGTSRRKFLGGLAAGAIGGAAATGSASGQVGGGPASDALADHRSFMYSGADSDRDSGGTARRYFHADDGTLYHDDGTGWSEADLGVSNLHSESVNTEETLNNIGEAKIQTAWDGLVVPVGQGLGMSDAIDPSATDTPVSDAAQKLRDAPGSNWSGHIILPPGGVDNNSSVTFDGDGGFVCPGPRASEIRFTSDTKGLIIGGNSSFIQGGLKLTGPGMANGSEPAIYSNTNSPWHVWDYIETEGWGGESLLTETQPMYFMNVGVWRAKDHDPAQNSDASENAVIDHHGGGISNSFGTMIIANDMSSIPSGEVPTGFYSEGFSDFQTLEVLGAVGDDSIGAPAVRTRNGGVTIGTLNSEGLSYGSNSNNACVMRTDYGTISVDFCHLHDRSVERYYYAFQPRGGDIPIVRQEGSTSITDKFVIQDPPQAGPVKFAGEQSEISDQTGSTGWTYGIECADGYLKP